jgi:ABC-type lipoprotein export system ATPase subunit
MPETTGCCDSRSKTKNPKDETGIDLTISENGKLCRSRTGREIMELLCRLNSDRVTIVMVTHTPEYAQYSHRVLQVADGVLA